MNATQNEAGNAVIKTSISMERDLFQMSKMVAKMSGFAFSYSAYIADLVRKDTECRLRKHQSALTEN